MLQSYAVVTNVVGCFATFKWSGKCEMQSFHWNKQLCTLFFLYHVVYNYEYSTMCLHLFLAFHFIDENKNNNRTDRRLIISYPFVVRCSKNQLSALLKIRIINISLAKSYEIYMHDTNNQRIHNMITKMYRRQRGGEKAQRYRVDRIGKKTHRRDERMKMVKFGQWICGFKTNENAAHFSRET